MGTDPKEARGVPLVEAIRQDAPNSRGRVLLGGRVLKLPYDWVKATALWCSVYPRCQMTRPRTIVGRYTRSVRQ